MVIKRANKKEYRTRMYMTGQFKELNFPRLEGDLTECIYVLKYPLLHLTLPSSLPPGPRGMH